MHSILTKEDHGLLRRKLLQNQKRVYQCHFYSQYFQYSGDKKVIEKRQ